MANDGTKNLKPQNKRTKEEQREIARKGGLASVEARRKQKSMREAMQKVMYGLKVTEADKDKLLAAGISPEDVEDFNNSMVATVAVAKKAKEGDVQAYNTICAMLGEKPADKVEMSGDMTHEVRIVYVGEDGDDVFPSSEAEVDCER